jgi:hypothetical protein
VATSRRCPNLEAFYLIGYRPLRRFANYKAPVPSVLLQSRLSFLRVSFAASQVALRLQPSSLARSCSTLTPFFSTLINYPLQFERQIVTLCALWLLIFCVQPDQRREEIQLF